jgi:hypothetical protein
MQLDNPCVLDLVKLIAYGRRDAPCAKTTSEAAVVARQARLIVGYTIGLL